MGKRKKAAPRGNGNQILGRHAENKGKQFSQLQQVFAAFQVRPMTMLEVSRETGIFRANICRYVGRMRKRDQIAVVKRGLCPISKTRAAYLTTDSRLFPAIPRQSTLFDQKGGAL